MQRWIKKKKNYRLKHTRQEVAPVYKVATEGSATGQNSVRDSGILKIPTRFRDSFKIPEIPFKIARFLEDFKIPFKIPRFLEDFKIPFKIPRFQKDSYKTFG